MPDARSPLGSVMSPPPTGYGTMPASKRPRLATEMSFPMSPQIHSPQPLVMTFQPPQASLAMPPPSSTSPIQKVDTNDLQDVLAGTGVDLKAEEQMLSDTLTLPESRSFRGSFHQYNPQGSMVMDTTDDWDSKSNQYMQARIRAMESHKTYHSMDPFLNQLTLRGALRTKTQTNQLGVKGELSEVEMLISLAVQDRLKELLGSANRLALHRRDGNTISGLGQWADIAIGEGEKSDEAQTDIPLEPPDGASSPSSANANPRKRSFSVANALSTSIPRKPKLISETARSLRALATAERSLEEARLAARTQKKQGTSSLPTTPDSTATPAGSSPLVAPELGERKMSAKETRKIHQSRIDEANSHRAANATASMMLGGGKKKKYSWLSAGAGGPGGSLPNSRPGTPALSVPAAAPRPPPVYWTRRMGEWNEQGEKGQRIQIRDWVGALEGDGRDKKTIVKAYLRMK